MERGARQLKGYGSRVFLGRDDFMRGDKITASKTLRSGQETGMLLQHFKVVHRIPIDGCTITILYTMKGMKKQFRKRIQVTDGSDFFTARGLPCSFTNLTDAAHDSIEFIEEDYSIVCAE